MLFFVSKAYSQHFITLTDSTPSRLIGRQVYYLLDNSEKLTFDQILSPSYNSRFVRSEKEVPNFGNIHTTVWNKIEVANQSNDKWVLIDLNDNDSITFYYRNTKGFYETIVAGASVPVSTRKYKTNVYAFDLPVKTGDSATYYLKIETRNCEYALFIMNYHQFVADQFVRILAKGIYFGLVLLLIVYNFTLFLAIRDKTYLYYIIYVLFTALLIAVLTGIYPFILQDKLHALWNCGPIITAIGGIFLAMFSKTFLHLKTTAPFINKVLNYFFIPLLVINIILTLTGNVLTASVSNQVIGPIGLMTMAAAAVYIYIKGYKPARYYILACSCYFIGACVYVLKVSAILPYNFITSNAMEFGSALEIVLFSLSMADRINIFRMEKLKVQSELIKSLQEKTSMKHQMLELEAKALRSQMNPHFIFNCMNSIKALIQQGQEQKAILYLTTFSKFVRNILQNADKTDITLYDEIEICELYTQLESLRFGNRFNYKFVIADDLDLKSIMVPALILQPFIENAIWHGIMPLTEVGELVIKVERKGDTVYCTVDDNGIGRETSQRIKFKHQPSTHQSKGVKLSQSRLDLDNALNNREAKVEIFDKADATGMASGTTILLTFKEY